MPDLTAPELIALLREHPGVCGMLGITFDGPLVDSPYKAWMSRYMPEFLQFGTWLTGAAVEKCDELWIVPVHTAHGWMIEGNYGLKGEPKLVYYPTRLHAALAALEQHAKESK